MTFVNGGCGVEGRILDQALIRLLDSFPGVVWADDLARKIRGVID